MLCPVCVTRQPAASSVAQQPPVQVVVHTGRPAGVPVSRPPMPGGRLVPPRALVNVPPIPKRTTGQKYGWIPAAGGVWSLMMISGDLWQLLAAIPLAAASAAAAWWLWRKHTSERLQNRSLALFRALQTPQVTKEQVVREHGMTPDQAEEVLNWLVARELLTTDWDQLEGPVVYRRASIA